MLIITSSGARVDPRGQFPKSDESKKEVYMLTLEAFIICSELNGHPENCRPEWCDNAEIHSGKECGFKLPRLDEAVRKLNELHQGAQKSPV